MVSQVVSVLALYSDNSSSNPAEVCNFYAKLLLKRIKIHQKGPGLANFLNISLMSKHFNYGISNP